MPSTRSAVTGAPASITSSSGAVRPAAVSMMRWAAAGESQAVVVPAAAAAKASKSSAPGVMSSGRLHARPSDGPTRRNGANEVVKAPIGYWPRISSRWAARAPWE